MISLRLLAALAFVVGCTLDLDVGEDRTTTRAIGAGPTLSRSVVGEDGSLYLTGTFSGTMQLGERVLMTAQPSAFVARLGREGEVLWVRSWSSPRTSFVSAVDVVGDEVWLAGYASGAVVGDLMFDAGGRQSAIIYAFSQESGEGRVERSWASPGGNAQAKSIAAAGELRALVGHYVGELDFGEGALASTPSTTDFGFVALFEGDTLRFAQALSGASTQAERVLFDGDTLLVSGTYRDGSLFDSPNAGGLDGFVTAIATDGASRWSQTYGSAGADSAVGCARVDGRSFVVGHVSGDAEFGVSIDSPRGDSDGFVHAIESDGTPAFAIRMGGSGVDRLGRVIAVDGGLIVAGIFEGTASFGELSVTSEGGRDLVLAGLSVDGEPRWMRRFGGSGNERLDDLQVDGDTLVVVATVSAAPDFGDGALTEIDDGALVVHRFRRP